MIVVFFCFFFKSLNLSDAQPVLCYLNEVPTNLCTTLGMFVLGVPGRRPAHLEVPLRLENFKNTATFKKMEVMTGESAACLVGTMVPNTFSSTSSDITSLKAVWN